ncbi:MAG: EamA family transporter [Cyanobacteria bacterium P01_A01_bin.84]
MRQFEQRPQNQQMKDDLQAEAENTFKSFTQRLLFIQEDVLESLHEDVKRLKEEKIQLANDVKRLQAEKEQLQQSRDIAELQALVRQVAQVLANHVSSQLQSSLENLAYQKGILQQETKENLYNVQTNDTDNLDRNSNHLVNSIDDALSISFNSLHQELNKYQSSLSQQLQQMHNKQQQGERILEELVNRLRSELNNTSPPLQSTEEIIESVDFTADRELSEEYQLEQDQNPFQNHQIHHKTSNTVLQPDSFTEIQKPKEEPQPDNIDKIIKNPLINEILEEVEDTYKPPSQQNVVKKAPSLPATEPPKREKIPETHRRKKSKSSKNSLFSPRLGLFLVLMSSVVSSLYNVGIKIIVQPRSDILGAFEMQRLISPTLGNSMLLLMLRMLVVIPLMLVLAPTIHPQVWQDLENLWRALKGKSSPAKKNAKRILILSIVSGGFLFLWQVLMYLSIGQIATGMATTLLFCYPIVTGFLSWFLFRDRLSGFRLGGMFLIGLGELLVLAAISSIGLGNVSGGSVAAIAAGIAFAFYVILTRICAAKLHPVSFTLINFCTMLVLSFIGLMLPLPDNWGMQFDPRNTLQLLELVLCAFVLGVMTLFGYLINNLGIHKIGATRAAILGAIAPVFTVILAGLIIQEQLERIQIIGVILVTLGVAIYNAERIRHPSSPKKALK